jgi:hypothetical protein
MEKLAFAEREEYEALTPEDRKAFHNMADFIHYKYPDRSTRAVVIRSKFRLQGNNSDRFWQRIEGGMSLTTAWKLLRSCEKIWLANTIKSRTWDDVVTDVFDCYDKKGVARSINGRTYRSSSPKARAERIAKGEESARGRRLGRGEGALSRHRTVVREAIAAWVAARMPKGDPRAKAWTSEFMREIEVVLESFTQRFSTAKPRRDDLFAACALLNIPRPRWGQPADQKRAWKNRKAALASTHPDRLGTNDGVDAFQAINDAYNVVVAYNDSLAAASAPASSDEEDQQPNKKESP